MKKVSQYFTYLILLITIPYLLYMGWIYSGPGFTHFSINNHHYYVGDFFVNKEVQRLITAATKGDTQTINTLVKKGINTNTIGKEGMTPLMWLMGYKQVNMKGLETLLKLGANPNFIDSQGISVMYIVGAGNSPKLLETILKYGGNPNIRNPKSWPKGSNQTVLMAAVEQDRLENVKLLVKYGANLEAENGNGMTALLWAAYTRSFRIGNYLLTHGANYHHRSFHPGYIGNAASDKINLMDLIEEQPFSSLSLQQRPYRLKMVNFLKSRGLTNTRP